MSDVTYRNLEFNLAIPASDLTTKMVRNIETRGLAVVTIETKHEERPGIREPLLFVTFTLESGNEQVKVDSVILPGNDWQVMKNLENSRNTDFQVLIYPADEYAMPIDIIYMGTPISTSEQ